MAKLSRKSITDTIVGGFIHVILPKVGGGWSSFRALLTNFIMSKQTYDPNNINSDAFDYENFINTPDLSLKADLVGGKVPAGQLPSYIDIIVELLTLASSDPSGVNGDKYYNTVSKKILTYNSGWGDAADPVTGVIYLTLDTELVYRWSGSTLVEISATPDLGSLIHGAPSKTPIINADELGYWDSISGLVRKISWTNLKSTLKTYFDTIYNVIGTFGDMFLASEQSVTGLKTFDKDKLAIKGTGDGINILSVANTSVNDYISTLQAKSGILALLSDLEGIQTDFFYDATVGTGGTYAEPVDAWNAGKYILKQVGNVTLTKLNQAPANKMVIIYGDRIRYSITMGNYRFDFNNAFAKTYNCKFVLNGNLSGSAYFSNALNYYSYDDYFSCQQSAGNSAIATNGYFSDGYVDIVSTQATIGFQTFNGMLHNMILNYGTSGPTTLHKLSPGGIAENCIVTGAYAGNPLGIFWMNGGTVNNLINNSGQEIKIYTDGQGGLVHNVVNLSGTFSLYVEFAAGKKLKVVDAPITTITLSGTTSTFILHLEDCKVTNNYNANYCIHRLLWCDFVGTLTVTRDKSLVDKTTCESTTSIVGDYIKFTDNDCTGLVTLASGSEYGKITGNTLTAGDVVNNSGNLTNIIKDNIVP